jgi:hypothetical protein
MINLYNHKTGAPIATFGGASGGTAGAANKIEVVSFQDNPG